MSRNFTPRRLLGSLRRSALLVCLSGSFLAIGCSTRTTLHPNSFQDGLTLGKAKVETLDNLEYRFSRVTIGADSLVGEYQVEVERQSRDTEIYYDRVTRKVRLPLSNVLRITQSKRDPSKTLLAGAGLFAFGFFVHDLSSDDGVMRTGGGGSRTKPDPR
ncbi:MAG: hypothetical protein U0527_14300 [Candidatus Eisenbacteria bacterium]